MLVSASERSRISIADFDELNARSWIANAALWSEAGTATPLRDAMFAEIDGVVAHELTRGEVSLVDLGCADGQYLAWLRRSGFSGKLFGIDRCSALISRARLVCPDALVTVADLNVMQSLPVSNVSIATCLLTLIEIAEPKRTLRNASAMLRAGGLLVVTVLDPTVEALRFIELKRGRPDTVVYNVEGEIAIGSSFEVQEQISKAPYFRFLRPLDYYINALEATGFALERISAIQDVDFPFQFQPRALMICARRQDGGTSLGR